jgi:hypothetical protein
VPRGQLYLQQQDRGWGQGAIQGVHPHDDANNGTSSLRRKLYFTIFTSKMLQAKDFKTLVLLKLAKLEPQRIVLV